jgi:Domain of unknown function (DUF4157)
VNRAYSTLAALLLVAIACQTPAQEAARGSPFWPSMAAGWIAGFRDDAIARGVNRIPIEIRAALTGFVPASVLDEVRWRIEGPTTMTGLAMFQTGSAYAISLDNVILFAGAEEAADPSLWAHEIYHVMQYRQWGVEGFANRYLADHRAVEHEAKEFQYRWWKATVWTGSR